MKAWTRWQDWVAVAAGLYVVLSPIWVSTTDEGGAVAAMLILGALLVSTGLGSLALPGVVATEYLTALWGVLLFVAPWVLTYTALDGAAWTSWIVGIAAFAVGIAAIPASTAAHRRAIPH